MPIYRIDAKKIIPIERTTFARQGLRERYDIQSLLKSKIDVLSPDTLVVAEEFGDWDDSRRRIDLLAIDKEANLVVIELKRTEDGGHMELQALLADYPDLIPGDQINFEEPRRWMLIARELGVPGVEDGTGRWSLDHLFLDQDGIPTFVECKRAS